MDLRKEDWQVRESEYIKSWERVGEARARLQTMRAFLLTVVRRVEDPVPESIRLAVEGTTDPDKLDAWIEAALSSAINAQTIFGQQALVARV